MEDLMSIGEAMSYLRMTRQKLAQLRFEGKGPTYMKPTPKTVLYRRVWIDEWLEASIVTRASDPNL